jgi:drug/metabolite transporter (DMT)-like permease
MSAVILILVMVLFQIPLSVSSSQLLYLSISGLIGLVFGDTFLFKSYQYNGARISALIMSTAPAITAILASVFLHEVLSFWGIVGILVTLLGIGVVILGRQESASTIKITSYGLFYAFLGAAGQGGGLILAKLAFTEKSVNGIAATLIRILASLIILVPLARSTGTIRSIIGRFSHDRMALGLTFLGAVLGPCLGITFSLVSIARIDVAIAATIMATVPILMLPLVKIIYHETLSWHAYCGAIIAVAGVGILFFR